MVAYVLCWQTRRASLSPALRRRQYPSKSEPRVMTAVPVKSSAAKRGNDCARVRWRGYEWQSQLRTSQRRSSRAMFSMGPPSIDHEPGHRSSAVSTATSRHRVSLEGKRRLAVLAAPLCSCILDHNHLTDDICAGTPGQPPGSSTRRLDDAVGC